MSWQPPSRPDWVEAINAGRILPIEAIAALPLERDALLAEARARQGLADGGFADFGHPRFPVDEMLDALDRVLAAIGGEAQLHRMGRFMARNFFLRLLEVRLQLMALLRADPGILDEEIESPLFVAGAPRTGTTLLHALLAADPARRAPLGWELLRPVPSPDPDPARRARDPRIELVEREITLPQTVVSGLLSIHVYGSRQPKECLSAMSFSFRSEEFTTRFHVPSFEAWLQDERNLRPAYAMHRLVLQVLQRKMGRARWILKSPVHLHSLATLQATYPDARIAITHRDPATMLASLTSLVAHLRWAHADVVDAKALARAHVERYARTLGRVAQEAGPGRGAGADPAGRLHLRYADLVADPFARVAELYRFFALELTDAFATKLRAEVERRSGREHGDHVYDLAALGLDREELARRFAAYCARFGLAEGD